MAVLRKCRAQYDRETVRKDTKNIYIFIDNLDRTSGNTLLTDENSDYLKKYKDSINKPIRYPIYNTSAVIRGLNNAFPITIKRRNWGNTQWGNSQFKEFKMVIDEDVKAIKRAIDLFRPEVVYFPMYGLLGAGAGVDISLSDKPCLFHYIIKKEKELFEYEPNAKNC